MDYLFFFLGLGLLLLGANYLVDSSVAIAQRAKISNFIIGLTIVGIGTSAPELFVSIQSALTGHGDIAMGNVLGSNIANVFLIMGVTATILPFEINREQSRRDIPIGIIVALLVFLLANDALIPGITENRMSRIDGILLLVFFIIYMAVVILKKGEKPKEAIAEADEETKGKLRSGDITIPYIPQEDALRNSIEHFAGCVSSGHESLANGEQGIKVIRILDQAKERLAAGSQANEK